MANFNSYFQEALKESTLNDDIFVDNENKDMNNVANIKNVLDMQTDDEILELLSKRFLLVHNLEKHIKDYERCVMIRRKYFTQLLNDNSMDDLQYQNFCYDKIFGQCCENVIGYVGIPVGIIGPLFVNKELYYIPMATTEGCLVASTNRGASCVRRTSKGIEGIVINDGITRAPVLRTESLHVSLNLKNWLEKEENYNKIKRVFDSTSKYARLKEIKSILSGRFIFLRFKASSGDAMGMNMISKGVEMALEMIKEEFGSSIEILSISGNLCSDKKATAINWIEGRGKSVICEVEIPLNIVETILKVSPSLLVETNIAKNLVGSAMSGTIGGFNAHAANVVTAVFIATGQDVAQVVESSQCLTYMELRKDYLYASCTMPCIEVGTVGGGTVLPSQKTCIDIMKLNRHESKISSSANLALVICASVLCSELSLMAALCTGTLVKSHLVHNRSHVNLVSQCDVI